MVREKQNCFTAAGPRQGSRSFGDINDVDGGKPIGDTKAVVVVVVVCDELSYDLECGDDGCEDADIVKDSNALEHVGHADVDEALSSDNFKRLNEGDSISTPSFSYLSVDTAGSITDSSLAFLLALWKHFVKALFIFDI